MLTQQEQEAKIQEVVELVMSSFAKVAEDHTFAPWGVALTQDDYPTNYIMDEIVRRLRAKGLSSVYRDGWQVMIRPPFVRQ